MVLMGLVALAAFSAIVMLLWNLLLPGLFGLSTINFWQASGLFILSRILFGRLGFGGGRMMMAHGMHGGGMNPIHKKWMKMTPEQRKEFIRKRRQFGFGHPFGGEHFDMEENEEQGRGYE